MGDKAHRALRIKRSEGASPCDVIIHFTTTTTKEAIVKYSRDNTLQYGNTEITIYQDLYPATLQRRKEWKPIAELLHQNDIRYTWGHHFKLMAFQAGKSHTLLPGEEPDPFL
ncbi:Hypothetical predicted protein [Pelobates cultripes]|uniref:Uncharacterized protein n=1 Tax=Pelobates cultripes TaxID=61616 RepID=A0AAD1TGT3_PELCU|nr:Hypothetical predicted protein [Pelobates cultripes]